ncbi:hypothetical protein [Sporolituus thermophilus]|uniref:Low molecular weight phosphotyrosine protein phosphatase n=1 Tax=Sporolituus thermophilus DSM 23256 TaxID=1123285 RepID=A0A1G7LR27_9FIRM|nr:hypothetical protein [Sporolituus thermophilus]SDF51972.1 hypothetical protein SAMN05660235_01875 [Sporolituus thermophilus DSM 23256]
MSSKKRVLFLCTHNSARSHHSFPDPSALTGADAEIMAGVARVRDQIKQWIVDTFGREE